jgi:hypothetical protein
MVAPERPATNCYEDEAWAVAGRVVSGVYPIPQEATGLRRGGRLPDVLVEVFARTIGLDVRRIRVHSGDQAGRIAQAKGVAAFAYADEIYFACGAYKPETLEGLALLAHEVAHVAQQGALSGRGVVRLRTSPRVQCASGIDPSKIYGLCPPGTTANSYPSSGPLGTAYGNYLGLMYVLSRPPKTYVVVDWRVWTRDEWSPGTVQCLNSVDPQVANALGTSEWTSGFLARRQRTDILDAGLDQVYEIKPVRDRAKGPAQLSHYLDTLRKLAPTTPWGSPRNWQPGDWDPSPYPLVVTGVGGKVCFMHSWRDQTTPGLLVYDIVCCVPDDPRPGEQPVLVPTAVKRWLQDLQELQSPVEEVLQAILPKAPAGATYAVIVPMRFFAAFVLPQWDRRMDQQLDKAFSVRPNPVLIDLILGTWAASQSISLTRDLTNLIWMSSPWMSTKQFQSLYKQEFAMEVTSAIAGFAGMSALGGEVAAAVVEAGAGDAVVADAAALGPLEADEVLVNLDGTPVDGPLIGGADIGEAAQVGPGFLPEGLGPPPVPPPSGPFAGLGLLGVLFIGAVATDADAAAANTTTGIAAAQPVGTDAIHLAPVELLHPYDGKVDLKKKVEYGGQDYVVIGIVTAEAKS